MAIRVASVLIVGTFAASCTTQSGKDVKAASTRPTNTYDRQEAALKDPFGYSPGVEKTDITGGDIRNFDRDAFKKDMDHVLNP